jgi:hypothetical protein
LLGDDAKVDPACEVVFRIIAEASQSWGRQFFSGLVERIAAQVEESDRIAD